MNKYEIMFILKANLSEEVLEETVNKYKDVIANFKGKILDFKDLGKKELAYEINNEVSGNYYLLNIESSTETVDEFKRIALIDDNMIRHLIIRLDEE